MRVLGHSLFLIAVLGLAVISCSDEEMEVEFFEPFIEASFINQRLLSEINTEISLIDTTTKEINARISEIDESEDRDELLAEKDSLNDVIDSLSVEKSALNSTATDIRNGEVNISRISGEGAVQPIVSGSTDSTTVYSFPLNVDAQNVRFYTLMTLGENLSRLDTIDIEYDITFEYEEFRINAIASQIRIPFNSFDSIPQCGDTLCQFNEEPLKIYF